MTFEKNDFLQILRDMRVVRRFETEASAMYRNGDIRGFLHLYSGQEAVCVGITAGLREHDFITTAYRCHGWAYTLGFTPAQILGELCGAWDDRVSRARLVSCRRGCVLLLLGLPCLAFCSRVSCPLVVNGKEESVLVPCCCGLCLPCPPWAPSLNPAPVCIGRECGASKGKGGSMHIYGHQFLGGNGIVGAQVPVGAGAGLALKQLKKAGVSYVLYGDGASNQGQVFEAYNMAKLWNLPVVFICENNKFGMGTSAARSSASTDYYTRGDYIPGLWVCCGRARGTPNCKPLTQARAGGWYGCGCDKSGGRLLL